MKFINIINELLNENIQQAEKILINNDIKLDDERYLELKNRIIKNNNISYLGFVIFMAEQYMRGGNTLIGEDIISVATELYIIMNSKKEYVKQLPKNVLSYRNVDEFFHDLNEIITRGDSMKSIKKFLGLISDRTLRMAMIDDTSWYHKYQRLIEYYFNNVVGTVYDKMFKDKLNRYHNIGSLFGYLMTINNAHEIGLSYDIVKGKLEGLRGAEIKVLYDNAERGIILVLARTYEAVKRIGAEGWCIVDSETSFNRHTLNGANNQYILFNFESDDIDEMVIGITMGPDGDVIYSYDRMDAPINNPMEILKRYGIDVKFEKINKQVVIGRSFEHYNNNLRQKDVHNNKNGLDILLSQIFGDSIDMEPITIGGNINNKINMFRGKIGYLIEDKVLKSANLKEDFYIYFKYLQDFKLPIYRVINEDEYILDNIISVNILEFYFENNRLPLRLVKVLEWYYTRGYKFSGVIEVIIRRILEKYYEMDKIEKLRRNKLN
jgi:hypothetical protein